MVAAILAVVTVVVAVPTRPACKLADIIIEHAFALDNYNSFNNKLK